MGIKRREFLGLTALGATGALLWQGRNLLRSRNSSPLAAPIPEIYRSEGGSLEINLEARYEDVILGENPRAT